MAPVPHRAVRTQEAEAAQEEGRPGAAQGPQPVPEGGSQGAVCPRGPRPRDAPLAQDVAQGLEPPEDRRAVPHETGEDRRAARAADGVAARAAVAASASAGRAAAAPTHPWP